MTTEAVQPGQEVAVQNQWDGMASGLEDFGAEDLKLNRLTIDQKAGVFKDTLSGIEYPKVHAIALGVIKQRVMWQPTVEDDSMPLCKSTDYNNGFPTTWDKPANNFPWAASGWQPTDFPKDDVGRIVLPCQSCRFTQWKTHPDGKKPWCSTQYAVPLLYGEAGDDPSINAVFTLQRSSLAAGQAYFASFMQRSMPAFSAVCEITLNKQRRGQNDYYVPALRTIGKVDEDRWMDLSATYLTMRDFLTRPPITRDENGEVVASNLAQSNTIQAQPVSNGFGNNTWVPTASPVAAAVMTGPIATPVQSAPIAQPVTQVVPQATHVPTVTAPVADDDSLPF